MKLSFTVVVVYDKLFELSQWLFLQIVQPPQCRRNSSTMAVVLTIQSLVPYCALYRTLFFFFFFFLKSILCGTFRNHFYMNCAFNPRHQKSLPLVIARTMARLSTRYLLGCKVPLQDKLARLCCSIRKKLLLILATQPACCLLSTNFSPASSSTGLAEY